MQVFAGSDIAGDRPDDCTMAQYLTSHMQMLPRNLVTKWNILKDVELNTICLHHRTPGYESASYKTVVCRIQQQQATI